MTIDLTGVAVSAIAGIFGVVGPVFLYWLQQHMKDQAAAIVIGRAVTNSLGAIQQAAQQGVIASNPRLTIAGIPAGLAPGVQYVLDNAGPELARYTGITPQVLAEKIQAQIGLKAIETNIATAASPAPTPLPLDPVPPLPSVIPAKAGTQQGSPTP